MAHTRRTSVHVHTANQPPPLAGYDLFSENRPLVEALRAAGWRVVALAADDGTAPQLRSLGAEFFPIALESSGTSPVRDARLLVDYWRILRSIRPHAFLGFTAKPNIYGSLAAGWLGIPTLNNISGLGTAFIRRGPLNWLVSLLYRIALVLVRYEIGLHSAKINTLGERVEDTFLITGAALKDTRTAVRLESELVQALQID